jgi:hypothetical protein
MKANYTTIELKNEEWINIICALRSESKRHHDLSLSALAELVYEILER